MPSTKIHALALGLLTASTLITASCIAGDTSDSSDDQLGEISSEAKACTFAVAANSITRRTVLSNFTSKLKDTHVNAKNNATLAVYNHAASQGATNCQVPPDFTPTTDIFNQLADELDAECDDGNCVDEKIKSDKYKPLNCTYSFWSKTITCEVVAQVTCECS